ncbi:MAG TPA: hypothetical protein DEH78_26795 [Solibacterales bacterium]|nr:hypothetical protein [Bryobacterales bacterium]
MAPRTALLATGLAAYAVSFALPAVKLQDMPPLRGWVCAAHVYTVGASAARDGEWLGPLLLACGLINPAMLLYLLFRFTGRARPRRVTALVLAGLLPVVPVTFAVGDIRPILGCGLWIAGMLLTVCGDFRRT